MSQLCRLVEGGLINRSQKVQFRFDGKQYQGYAGETLASALMANGVTLLGRSFKYHRPRGLYTAGAEEPNALIQLRSGARNEPNTRATMVELYDGLEAWSQNRWPSLHFDLMSINQLFSPFLGAGFYYKTFMWPKSFWEKVYEPAIRRAAGLGTAGTETDPDHYERVTQHCDVLVVGAGPCGLLAASIAAQAGANVVIVDEMPRFGGSLLNETSCINNQAGAEWAGIMQKTLARNQNVVCLPRTTAFSYDDHNLVACVERVNDHVAKPLPDQVRQRLWRIHAQRVILATGALERPLVFSGNDRPGVMLASATRTYVNQFAIDPGKQVCVFTNNDSAYQTVTDLTEKGIGVRAVIDSRHQVAVKKQKYIEDLGVDYYAGAQVINTRGWLRIQQICVRTSDGVKHKIACDHLAVSGGWNPNIQLFSQTTAPADYDETQACFVPGASRQAEFSVGAAAGSFELDYALTDTFNKTMQIIEQIKKNVNININIPEVRQAHGLAIEPLWQCEQAAGKAFVDLQNDVTAKDVLLAVKEGFTSVEHLKRYTTLGMATDQGKGANLNGLAIMAGALGRLIPEVGTTRFRPPVSPVTLGVFAGPSHSKHKTPTRHTATHRWGARHGAVCIEVGQWLRAWYYPREGETLIEASRREVKQTRAQVGLCDVSTLGKIDIQGKDAAAFLHRIYSNYWMKLPVGKARYGLMLREDGMVMDDGTTSRLGENHFFMTTTTVNAAKVLAHLEFHLQVTWPELDVQVASVSEQWAGFAIAGPKARTVLQLLLGEDLDLSNEVFPFLGATEFAFTSARIPTRVFRISFSGELAFEIYVPADYGESVWKALLRLGEPENIIPYGTEALAIMRIEKGHVAGPELSGTTTPGDLGMSGMAGQKKDYIGRYLLQRPGLNAEDRETLVGIEPVGDTPLWEGAHLIDLADTPTLENDQGYISSATFSPSMNKWIGLALLKNGRARIGDRLRCINPILDRETEVNVVSPHYFAPDNERLMT
jgi:heterotetrameric sarcosine oxidase alpha subunit